MFSQVDTNTGLVCLVTEPPFIPTQFLMEGEAIHKRKYLLVSTNSQGSTFRDENKHTNYTLIITK